MTESRDALTTATVGAAEEARDYVNRVVNAWSEASERYVRTLQHRQAELNRGGRPCSTRGTYSETATDAVAGGLRG
jgi:hypothetical protein